MRLIECHIENFGKLQNVDFKFSKGVTVICEKNGWGKSTLASFLKVMFYGFENERARDDFSNERKRYRPWQGGPYGGSVTFQVGKKTYVLTRIFGLKEKEDVFSLKDASTNLDSGDFSTNVGEELFQIDRASFERTIFLSQNDCQTKATGSISAKIGDLAENNDDINHYEKADERLNDLLNGLSPSRKTGTLYKMKEDMARMEMSIRTGVFKDVNMQKLADTFYSQFLERKEEEAKKRSFFGPEIPAEQDVLEQIELCTRLKAAEKMELIQKKQADDAKGNRRRTEKKVLLFAVVGIFLSVLGIVLWNQSQISIIPLFLGVFNIMIACILLKGNEKNSAYIEKSGLKEEIWAIRNQMEVFLENYGFEPETDYHSQLLQILDKLREYERAGKEREMAGIRMDEFDMEYEEAKKKHLAEMESELRGMQETYEQLMEKYKRLKLTREYLKKSKEAFTAKYQNPLMQGFSRYYRLLTAEDAAAYVVNANMELSVKEEGLLRDTKYLSDGLKDLTGICMRMAFVDAMYEKEKPFLIFDDPFINLDKEKTNQGLHFLAEIGKEYQMIYFTCHESRKMEKLSK